jgi:3-methyladenine DNA glycosylase AlkD
MIRDIQNELVTFADPQKAALLARFFKTGKGEYAEGDIFLGVTVPDARRIAKKYAALSHHGIHRLLTSKYHEERLIALLIMIEQFKNGDAKTKDLIYQTYITHTAYINNWDLVDLSAKHIMGAFLELKPKNILSIFAASQNLWERRIAVLATFYYIGHGDCTESLRIARILLHDEHDLIHKAVGWMLREIGKQCSQKVLEDFLKKHYKTMPRTMLRYAIERLPKKRRSAYLHGTL